MYTGLHVKYPLILRDFNETWIFPIIFLKYSNAKFHANLFTGSQVINPDGKRIDITKLTIACSNIFA